MSVHTDAIAHYDFILCNLCKEDAKLIPGELVAYFKIR